MRRIRVTVRPTLLRKMMLKSISDCYFAEEAYRSLGMSLAAGKSPTAISTHVMSPYCPSYLFPRSKGYRCAGGSEVAKQWKSKISISNTKTRLESLNPSSELFGQQKQWGGGAAKTDPQVVSFKEGVNTLKKESNILITLPFNKLSRTKRWGKCISQRRGVSYCLSVHHNAMKMSLTCRWQRSVESKTLAQAEWFTSEWQALHSQILEVSWVHVWSSQLLSMSFWSHVTTFVLFNSGW